MQLSVSWSTRITSQDMTSSASLGTMATPRVEVSVRQWLTEGGVRERRRRRREGDQIIEGGRCHSLTKQITDEQALPCERRGSEDDTSKQSITVSPCAEDQQTWVNKHFRDSFVIFNPLDARRGSSIDILPCRPVRAARCHHRTEESVSWKQTDRRGRATWKTHSNVVQERSTSFITWSL